MMTNATQHGVSYEDAFQKYIGIHQLPIPKEHDLIEVESSFGGIAVYQTKYIRDCMYSGYGENGRELCEHAFHRLFALLRFAFIVLVIVVCGGGDGVLDCRCFIAIVPGGRFDSTLLLCSSPRT
ncbi:unnamed protein product [Rotaria sp. Silwood2]|nr:unnamed protein product [Rotaria sp. Silwood2]